MKFNIDFLSSNCETSELQVEAESLEEASKIAHKEASKRRAVAIVSEIEDE